MRAVFIEAVKALEKGEPCVLATVIRTKGSTPQKPGAKLLVRADGTAAGTIGGGCVEGDIWFAAKVLLREGGGPQVREYVLNEELAARDGLICGGTMYFLIDPIYTPASFLPFAREVLKAYEGGPPVALATLTKPPAQKPLPPASKLLLWEDGRTEGGLGDPGVEREVAQRAKRLLPYDACDYLLAQEGAEVFIESFTSPPTLVLMGGGHISKALAPMAKALGFRIYVVDDRPQFANPERFPEAEATVVAPYDQGLEQVPVNANTYIVVATRGHRYDDMATEAAARSPARYVGLVGSKRKSILIFEELFKKGIPEERIKSIRAPVGLDIGGRTPEEIAVSILAEVLMVRLGGSGLPLKMAERLVEKAQERALARR